MRNILLYLLFIMPITGISQVRHVSTTTKGKYLITVDFSASHKGFCLMEKRTNQLTKVSELEIWSGTLEALDADSTSYDRPAGRGGYVWISLQAQYYKDFFYSRSVSKEGKPVKYNEGVKVNCLSSYHRLKPDY